MNLFEPKVKKLIENTDYSGLKKVLSDYPNLANKGITIPFDLFCRAKAHPLHRICDAVFARKITDDEAVNLAKVFLENGANIDGDKMKNEGTPLLAAASLHAEQLGIFYIDNGADVHYTYKNDGASALHWAAFCGRDKLVERLIKANAEIDEPDTEHKSTPIGWAIHSLQSNDMGNKYNQLKCIKLLLRSGVDTNKLDKEKYDYLHSLSKDDPELQNLLT
ncbi:ankyrin repeat domain-containing protein [Geojedonia litorea]|uniref:Ankyrin repeat domain-containing protein n=1 Tax=Geojedonia litorea TaxID=1268269 RepID=A0ABV9N175_9FLAO